MTAANVTVIGTVDDEWRIDRLSADITTLLGIAPDSLHGSSMLTLIHPGDLSDFLTGLGHAHASGGGVAVRLRLRDAAGQWRWSRAKLSPLDGRSAFAFVLGEFALKDGGAHSAHDLEQTLARIAHQVHSVTAARRTDAMPSVAELPALSKLTSREWEIVMLIRAEARIPEVARAMHLSASTVRNHLSAVYRKLGVHSLAELVVLLHGGVISQPGPARE
jgi:DNA-binding CsgD family transcriptional regulator